MKKLHLMTASLLLFAVAGCNCPCSCFGERESAEGIVAKVEKAVDVSGKQNKITSALIVYDSGLAGKNKSRVSLKFKEKNKLRLKVALKDYIMLRAYNGKIAWEYVTSKGLHEIKGRKLNELKFQASYLAPSVDYSKLFKEIKLDGEAKVAGQKCWKLICTPYPEFERDPVVIFVNKENYFVIKTIEKYTEDNEKVEMVTYFGEYRDIGGVMMPRLMIFRMEDQFLETKLISAEWNIEIDDSEFDMPKKLTTVK